MRKIEQNTAYFEWLSSNSMWSSSTVQKYESAVRVTSEDMLLKHIIEKDIYKMNLIELDAAIYRIFNNKDFIKKNTVGNHMYSVGLKHYRAYFASCIACNNYENEDMKLTQAIISDHSIKETERTAIIMSRIGQGKFR